KIVSITVSFFTSVYVMKWKEFFLDKDLKSALSFDARTICYPSTKIVRDYLAWRQDVCNTFSSVGHINNQYNTCLWMLIGSGMTESEAQADLCGKQKQDKNEILFQRFRINYAELPAIFRKGSCVFKVRETDSGLSVKRGRTEVVIDHCDIIRDKFWKNHVNILEDK
ncbi:hypothetical protein MKX03_032584, partial [Papaver bracteatum]